MARTVWKIIGSSAFRGREFNSATEAARALYLSGVEWAPEYERAFGRNAARQACEDQNHLYNRIELVSEVVSNYGIDSRWSALIPAWFHSSQGPEWTPLAANAGPWNLSGALDAGGAVARGAGKNGPRAVFNTYADAAKRVGALKYEMRGFAPLIEFRIVSL